MLENSQKINIIVKLEYKYIDAQSSPTFFNPKFFSKTTIEIVLLIHPEPEEIHRHFPKNNSRVDTFPVLFRDIRDTMKLTVFLR